MAMKPAPKTIIGTACRRRPAAPWPTTLAVESAAPRRCRYSVEKSTHSAAARSHALVSVPPPRSSTDQITVLRRMNACARSSL